MADDLQDAEQMVTDYRAAPFENNASGAVIVRLIRHVRMLTTAVKDMKARLDRIDPGG